MGKPWENGGFSWDLMDDLPSGNDCYIAMENGP